MCSAINFDAGLQRISEGASLLTVNERLARDVRRRYHRWQREQGHSVWRRGEILSLKGWCHRNFEKLVDLGLSQDRLLLPCQSALLWERVIANSDVDQLVTPSVTARVVEDTWKLIHSWGVSIEELADWPRFETVQLLRWIERYLQQCDEHNWLDEARLLGFLIEQISLATSPVSKEILLAGFNEPTPQQLQLFDSLAQQGSQVRFLKTQHRNQHDVVRVAMSDASQELVCAIQWLGQQLQRQPTARLGLIVPGLSKQREQVEQTLQEQLHPQTLLPGQGVTRRVYHLSLGRALSRWPIVSDALLLLGLIQGELDYVAMSRFLRSPFFAGGRDEWPQRSRLDACIRKQISKERVSLEGLLGQLHQAKQNERDACPQLTQALEKLHAQTKTLPVRQSPTEWASAFYSLLEVAGWAAVEQRLESDEYQTVQRFFELLSEFSRLGLMEPSMTLSQACTQLQAMAHETLFQTQDVEAPIQVMGVLEASGLEFDALWVAEISEERWPQAVVPNPLLPIELQRERGMPHASERKELEFARQVLTGLYSSAPKVVISHAMQSEERTVRPSPLILDLQSVDKVVLGVGDAGQDQDNATVAIEWVDDSFGPTVASGSYVRGGAGLFADQAACPFRAFALHRLGATRPEEPMLGADPRLRGELIHRVLESFWSAVEGKSQLNSLSDHALRSKIEGVVKQQLAQMRARYSAVFTPRFVTLEQDRLCRLLLQWIEHEKARADFQVTTLEQRQRASLGGFEFTIRADRIDRLEDGRWVLIDYKSGSASIKGWFDERMQEPQLPLYSVLSKGDVAAVFIAKIKAGELGFIGISRDADTVRGEKAFAESRWAYKQQSWSQCLALWDERLRVLAQEIRDGRADVTPQDPNKSCQYCPLGTLCRIHEQWLIKPEWESN